MWLKPFLGLTSLRASPFYVLRTFQWLRRFYGFDISRFAVSMASPSVPAAFNADAVSLLRCGVPRHNNVRGVFVQKIVNRKSKI